MSKKKVTVTVMVPFLEGKVREKTYTIGETAFATGRWMENDRGDLWAEVVLKKKEGGTGTPFMASADSFTFYTYHGRDLLNESLSNNPMTYTEAMEKYKCAVCQSGGYCGTDCVRSETCSIFCKKCMKPTYFSGDLEDAPPTFRCPYCGEQEINRFHKEKKKETPLSHVTFRERMAFVCKGKHFKASFKQTPLDGEKIPLKFLQLCDYIIDLEAEQFLKDRSGRPESSKLIYLAKNVWVGVDYTYLYAVQDALNAGRGMPDFADYRACMIKR